MLPKPEVKDEGLRQQLDVYLADKKIYTSFLYALLTNNLVDTMAFKPDHIDYNDIPKIVSYFHWELPSNAWGSPTKVMDYMSK